MSVFQLEGEGPSFRYKVLADFPSASRHQMEQMAERALAAGRAGGILTAG